MFSNTGSSKPLSKKTDFLFYDEQIMTCQAFDINLWYEMDNKKLKYCFVLVIKELFEYNEMSMNPSLKPLSRMDFLP